jgi:hypothetical protein
MTGIEPVDLFLTKEALYRLSYMGSKSTGSACGPVSGVERATRFELATSSLEGWSSTS